MKNTAVHSNTTFSSRALETGSATETPHVGSGRQSSTTPVPAATQGGTPKGVASTPQDPAAKAPAGGGKKKRKRGQAALRSVRNNTFIGMSQGPHFERRVLFKLAQPG